MGEFFWALCYCCYAIKGTRARCCLAARHLKVRGLLKWLKVPNRHAARGDAYSCRESIRKTLNFCGEVYIVTCFSQFFNRALKIFQSGAILLCLIVSLIYKSLSCIKTATFGLRWPILWKGRVASCLRKKHERTNGRCWV